MIIAQVLKAVVVQAHVVKPFGVGEDASHTPHVWLRVEQPNRYYSSHETVTFTELLGDFMGYLSMLTLLVCGSCFAYASAAEGRQQRPGGEDLQAKREAFKERLAQHREQHGEGQGDPCRERMEAVRERLAAMHERRSSGDGPQRPANGEAGEGQRGPRQQGLRTN